MEKSLTNVKSSSGLIIANLVNLMIDYKKYDGSVGGTAIFMQNPLNSNVTVQIKDGKYKVAVTSIVFLVDMHGAFGINLSSSSAESLFLKSDLTDYKIRSGIVESGGYMEQQFNDIFSIKSPKSDW
jgi:hypothetical protein